MKGIKNQSPTQSSSWPGRLVREPLVHFLLLGGLLFGAYYFLNDEPQVSDDNRIAIDEAQMASLAATFQRTWMRPPTQEELAGLVEDRVKEEILYREALALGLDRDDLVIRRRMRQKMEFLNTDLLEPEPPTEAELQAYLDDNMDQFRTTERFSFIQVYVKEDSRERATALLQQLTGQRRSEVDLAQLGDASLLPGVMQQADRHELGRVFGNDFAATLSAVPLGRWSGPHGSPYGLHLVYVSERLPAREPPLSEVRSEVEREWLAERRREANARFYQALRERYTVEVAYPKPAAGDDVVAMQP
ncbi:MAG: peptidylprolyl isomerase [Gammaproteobacteria bacterium]|jgi:parvulin-like peptidyl-prolyl isomerase